MNAYLRFQHLASELTRLSEARDATMLEAFAALEAHSPELAALALQSLGDRIRAARWMSMHQRAFGGMSAYELLVDGDVDTVWDRLSGSTVPEVMSLRGGSAY
jgi:hypothetical protein